MGIVIEFQYFSPIILFKSLCRQTHLLFEQYESYQKMSFRNRCVIVGADGPKNLSVPLQKGRNQKTLTKDIRIDNRHYWQDQHWKTLTSCYNRSPWFEYYIDELHQLYNRRFSFLVDWNMMGYEWVSKTLDLKLSVNLTADWNSAYGECWEDWRSQLMPNSIEKKFPSFPKYKQVFEDRTGFIPHLSILDLMFCEGKNARTILSS
jgi:hypothetical protein